jgi:hypothetical protein
MISKLRDQEEGELKTDGDSPEDGKGWDKDTDGSKYPRDHRNYIGIATSDTPYGPFTPLARMETVTVDGEEIQQKVPCINFPVAFDMPITKKDDLVNMIDVNPFIDEDGSLYLYIPETETVKYIPPAEYPTDGTNFIVPETFKDSFFVIDGQNSLFDGQKVRLFEDVIGEY